MGARFPREAYLSVFEVPLFDAAAVRELFVAVGPPDDAADKAEAVAFRLSEIAKSCAFDLFHEAQARTPERERGAKAMVAACDKLLEVAGLANDGELLPMFGQGGLFAAAALRGEARGEAATMNALHAVKLLRQDAAKMLEVEGKRRAMSGPKRGRPESRAMRRMVADMSALYERVWERAPGISNGPSDDPRRVSEEPSGPLMRLMLDLVAKLRARGVRVSASPDSLRAVWRRVPDDEKMPGTHIIRLASSSSK